MITLGTLIEALHKAAVATPNGYEQPVFVVSDQFGVIGPVDNAYGTLVPPTQAAGYGLPGGTPVVKVVLG